MRIVSNLLFVASLIFCGLLLYGASVYDPLEYQAEQTAKSGARFVSNIDRPPLAPGERYDVNAARVLEAVVKTAQDMATDGPSPKEPSSLQRLDARNRALPVDDSQ